jgi:23S rRNA pseudouridine1911/1915/1917 synthase
MKQLSVDGESAGQRLDVYVVENRPELSRSFIKKLCEDGKVLVNKQPAKVGQKLREGDQVQVDFEPVERASVQPLDLTVIYEDSDCVVINKPAGVLTHSKGAFNPEPTVATFVGRYWKGPASDRAGIVHRLDRGTSGVII